MSYALKQAAIAKIETDIAEITRYLLERTLDPLDQMRVNQGVIRGLERAKEHITEAMKELVGEK